ncbi:ubiquitin-related modifier 1 [Flagelloscypha sp. PMI_526]|nr:ubiquitin-related modifier 1 [Flagelloscypha sp. PMI_526]
MAGSNNISLKIEFSGGLELLFNNQRTYTLSVPAKVQTSHPDQISSAPNILWLIHHLRDTLLKERAELFIENDTVRPGILVLINDTDWELEGEGEYKLQDNDHIIFISTLHGG